MHAARAWLDVLNHGVVYAGDRITATLNLQGASLDSDETPVQTFLYGSIQLTGVLCYDSRHIESAWFEGLKHVASYGEIGGGGGGNLFGHEQASSAPPFTSRREVLSNAPDNGADIPVFSTPPSILFTEKLQLKIGSEYAYRWELVLPHQLPPTHHGRLFRIIYHVSVGLQREKGKQPIFLGRYIRVLPFYTAVIWHHDYSITESIGERPSSTAFPKTPPDFLKGRDAMFTVSDYKEYIRRLRHSPKLPYHEQGLADHNIALLVNMSSKESFDICKGKEPIAKILLMRAFVRLGETFTAMVYFENTNFSVYQVQVSLQSYEEVAKQFAKKSPEKSKISFQTHKSHESICWLMDEIDLRFSMPVDISPSFETSIAAFKWQLHFKFYVGPKDVASSAGMNSQSLEGFEIFDGIIPIEVLAPSSALAPIVKIYQSHHVVYFS